MLTEIINQGQEHKKKKKKGKKEEGSRIQVKINAKKHALPIRI